MSQTELLLTEWGLGEPPARALATLGLVGIAIYNMKPSYFFRNGGTARPAWILTGDRNDPEASIIPWWWIPLGAAFAAGAF